MKYREVNHTREENKARKKRLREARAWTKPYCQRNDQYKQELKRNITPAEVVFKNTLKAYGIKHQFQKGFFSKEFHCIVDFWIKASKVAVEIDGGYHFTAEQKRKDDYRTRWILENRNFIVVRFTNDEVINDCDGCLKKLAEVFLKQSFTKYSNNHKIFSSLIKSLIEKM